MQVRFTYAIYHNETNGYCTYKYKNIETDKNITCVGYNLPTVKILFNFEVQEVHNPKYGLQYEVLCFEEVVTSEKDSIIEYLSCGLIKGIGKKTAERIYDKFQDKSVDVIKEHPEALLSIKGISPKKLEEIKESVNKNTIPTDLVSYLNRAGFSTEKISKVYKLFKEDSMKILEENPYRLCDIRGVTFKDADYVAELRNISKNDPNRIYAGIIQALKNQFAKGCVGVLKEELLSEGSNVLQISDKRYLWKWVILMIKENRISYRKIFDGENIVQYFYLNSIKQTEEELAKMIADLCKKRKDEYEAAKPYINQIELQGNVKMDAFQSKAVEHVFKNMLSIVSGGPGTGKTTTIDKIAKTQKALHPDEEIRYFAPSALAAKRISESVGERASTIHSGMGIKVYDGFDENDENAFDEESEIIEGGMLIIDEFSMVSMKLFHKVLKNIKDVRLVLVGDKEQLGSVGAGAVLRDCIKSGIVPVTYLQYVHRQEEGSTIKDNAHAMLKGVTELVEGDDFECVYLDEIDEYKDLSLMEKMDVIEKLMVEAYVDIVRKTPDKKIMCLCPYRDHKAGLYSVNSSIQAQINPIETELVFHGLNNMVFHEGDQVMHVRTNTEDVVNGDMGIVTSVNLIDGKPHLTVSYEMPDDTIIEKTYYQKNAKELCLSYAITFHKSQGSECEVAILCLTDFHSKMLKRSILYTGITRAKKKVKLFATSKDAIRRAILDDSQEDRHTLLAYLIREYYGENYMQQKLAL